MHGAGVKNLQVEKEAPPRNPGNQNYSAVAGCPQQVASGDQNLSVFLPFFEWEDGGGQGQNNADHSDYREERSSQGEKTAALGTAME